MAMILSACFVVLLSLHFILWGEKSLFFFSNFFLISCCGLGNQILELSLRGFMTYFCVVQGRLVLGVSCIVSFSPYNISV